MPAHVYGKECGENSTMFFTSANCFLPVNGWGVEVEELAVGMEEV
jgi:hypothetical protein